MSGHPTIKQIASFDPEVVEFLEGEKITVTKEGTSDLLATTDDISGDDGQSHL